jgi:hypothetical protein
LASNLRGTPFWAYGRSMILIGVPLTTIIQCLGERRRSTQQFFRDAIVKRSLRHGKRKSF